MMSKELEESSNIRELTCLKDISRILKRLSRLWNTILKRTRNWVSILGLILEMWLALTERPEPSRSLTEQRTSSSYLKESILPQRSLRMFTARALLSNKSLFTETLYNSIWLLLLSLPLNLLLNSRSSMNSSRTSPKMPSSTQKNSRKLSRSN